MKKAKLSTQQTRVVEHVDGPLLVVAGPGAGKTRVLTERIRRLLTEVPGHFRVLALTFTNKAANEMQDRLLDLGKGRERAFIGTLHSFCLEILTERGKPVGVDGLPQIFERVQDRKQVLLEAVLADPFLSEELSNCSDVKERNALLDSWLKGISWRKAHPISTTNSEGDPDDELATRILDAYDAGLRACGAYDFDDLLLLAYRLLNEFPQIADFYGRLYRFICIDEAQDLNEAQYGVLRVLCGDEVKNVMMVGDPKQSIYGFNTSSPDFMYRFRDEFGATEIELTENFRSSQAVVRVAQSLEPSYMVEAQLPIAGTASVLVGNDEVAEARLVVDEIARLVANGHPDVEGGVTTSSCAVLGRTRFALLAIERELKERSVPYYKRLTANHENESSVVDDFQLGLRVLANPRDRLHLAALAKKWKVPEPTKESPKNPKDVVATFTRLAGVHGLPHQLALVEAVTAISKQTNRLDLMLGVAALRTFADTLTDLERLAVYEDTTVLEQEWDQYLRSAGAARSIGGFMSSSALGTTQNAAREGVALLTVHSSKGLEFDVVFVACMVDGVFPDYRAKGKAKEMAEERRNAFVSVTRSKRLLYFSYPERRVMPWGDERLQQPSPYLVQAGLIG